ncbi:MAG: hypothetical protein IKE03_06380 [Blautia sp.]|nr:hypothetical protein [Blautia sp.]
MMNQEQEILHTLLRELDQICRNNNLRYILSPRLAYNAVNGLGMPANLMYGMIMVAESDMERLRLALSSTGLPDRAVESMADSDRFPGFYLRYVDRSTLCYRLSYGRSFRYPCLGINIYPMYSLKKNPVSRMTDRFLERGWLSLQDTYQSVFSWKDYAAGAVVWLMGLRGRARLGKSIYYRLVENRRELPGSLLFCEGSGPGGRFSHEMIAARTEVELEGWPFFIPRDYGDYMEAAYGARAGKKAKIQTPSWSVVTSACVKGEEFIYQIPDTSGIVRKRRALYLRGEQIRQGREYVDECWELLRYLEKGQNIVNIVQRQKRRIRNLWHDGDYRRLERVYREYHEFVKDSLSRNILLRPDQELYEIYLDMLRHTGSFGWLKRILAVSESQKTASGQ